MDFLNCYCKSQVNKIYLLYICQYKSRSQASERSSARHSESHQQSCGSYSGFLPGEPPTPSLPPSDSGSSVPGLTSDLDLLSYAAATRREREAVPQTASSGKPEAGPAKRLKLAQERSTAPPTYPPVCKPLQWPSETKFLIRKLYFSFQHQSGTNVPIFALHPRGSYYIPLSIEYTILAPFMLIFSSPPPPTSGNLLYYNLKLDIFFFVYTSMTLL